MAVSQHSRQQRREGTEEVFAVGQLNGIAEQWRSMGVPFRSVLRSSGRRRRRRRPMPIGLVRFQFQCRPRRALTLRFASLRTHRQTAGAEEK